MDLFTETPGTIILILLNAVVTLVGWHQKDWFYKLVLHPFRIFRKEHLSGFFSSGFLHKNLSHFGINMGVLFVFGSNLEVRWNQAGQYGAALICIVYLSCLTISNGISVLYNRNKIEFTSCGASPAVMGALFCYVRMEPLEARYLLPSLSVPNIWLIPIFMAVITLAHLFRKEKIDHLGHLTGLLAGQLIFSLL